MIFNLCPFMYTVLVWSLRILVIPRMEAAAATHIPADIIPAIALNMMGVKISLTVNVGSGEVIAKVLSRLSPCSLKI